MDVAVPTRFSATVFRLKAALLQIARVARNVRGGIRRHPQHAAPEFAHCAAASVTRLWMDANPSEVWHQRGKIQNLRVAASRLDGCVIPAGEVFSFWAQVGRASARRGFAHGRMLQEGCMIPAVGGGICQLSNALYQVALDAGCEIVERHSHSRVVPGSATAEGRDATVAWNYIDLRFRPRVAMQLRVRLTATELQVSSHTVVAAQAPAQRKLLPVAAPVISPAISSDHVCESCGNTACFRHASASARRDERASGSDQEGASRTVCTD